MRLCNTGLVNIPSVYRTEFSGKQKLCREKDFAQGLTTMLNGHKLRNREAGLWSFIYKLWNLTTTWDYLGRGQANFPDSS